jgi:hypothetical protein
VEAAKPPEDYIYENLHYSRFARYTRMVSSCSCPAMDKYKHRFIILLVPYDYNAIVGTITWPLAA